MFLLHDASNPSTLESLRTTWLPLVQAAFGTDPTKSAVIIRSKNDLFTGVSDYRLSSADQHQLEEKKQSKPSTTTATASGIVETTPKVSSDDLAVSQDGTGFLCGDKDKNPPDSTESEIGNHTGEMDMAYSFVGVDITHPDKFSTAELQLGKEYSFISALSMYVKFNVV